MVGIELFRNSWFRATAACCGVLILMVAVTGCPTTTVDHCAAAGGCNDNDTCTHDVCTIVEGEAVCDNPLVECTDGLVCDGETGDCVDLCADVTCDDENPCTVDACNPETGMCLNTPDDALCPDGKICDPEDPDADANGCVPA